MKIDLDNIDWDQFDREHIREHAIHESGHAVVEFLYGRAWGHLVHISLRGTNERAGYVRRERCMDVRSLRSLKSVPEAQREFFRRMAIREGMMCFAGPAAEAKAFPDDGADWFW